MRIKKVLSLAVVLAMVLTVVPMFGLTASAADGTYTVEFTLNMNSGDWYKDIKIVDTEGQVITGFVLAESEDGFFPFVREGDGLGEKKLIGTAGDVTDFEGADVHRDTNNKKTHIWYKNGEAKVTVEITNGDGSYTVKYKVDGALKVTTKAPLEGYEVSCTYTGGTVAGIETPDKWVVAGGHAWVANSGNICNYLKDMKITNADAAIESKTFTATYQGAKDGKTYTYTAPVGTTFSVPAYAELDETGAIKSWAETSETIVADGNSADVSSTKVEAIAQYTFNATDKAKTVMGSYGDATLNNEQYLEFSDNGYVTYKGNGTDFVGTGVGYVDLPGGIINDLDGNFTVSMWIKQNNVSDSSTAFWDMCQTDGNGSTDNRIYLKRANTKKLNANRRKNGTSAGLDLSSGDFNDAKGTWALVTTSFDWANKKVTAHVNGDTREANITNSDAATASPKETIPDNAIIHLGRDRWASNDNEKGNNPALDGSIADVRIYNSVLTAEEAAALMGVHKVAAIKFVAGDQEIADAVNVDTFTDTVTFDVPKTITNNGVIYELKSGDFTEGANTKSYAETITVNYDKKELKLKEPSKEVTLDAETIIEGNVPGAQYVELETNDEEITKIQGIIDWESVKDQFKYTDGQTPTTVTADVKVDNVADANITAKIDVTVLPCSYGMNDQGADNGGNVHEKLKSTVTKEVYIEFDVKINAAGDYSVNFGKDGGRWGQANSGYSVNVDSRDDQHKIKVTYGDGSTGSKAEEMFTDAAKIGETYRVLAKVDAENHSGEVAIFSPTGQIKTFSGVNNFRDTSLKEINSVNVCTSGSAGNGIVITNVKVYDPNVAPSQPVATLGYDGGAFTMDIAYGEIAGDSIKVTADSSFEKTEKTTEGVTLKTGATNRNYTITAVNGSTDGTPLTTSIYELVVKAVAEEAEEIKADKLAAANKVIAEGGIITVDSIAEDGVRNQIMKKIESENVSGIEIIETIFNKGIGFVVSEGKIYVGNEPQTAANVTTSGEGTKGVYRYMKIDGIAVTLSNDSTFTTEDAVTLSLDSVNIEFVETLVEELEAEGADAAQDFIPEL